jgi:hypothetical protein
MYDQAELKIMVVDLNIESVQTTLLDLCIDDQGSGWGTL